METRIKELRLQRRLTQTGLAMEINCSQNLISKIELGKVKPTSDMLKSLSAFFNVSIDYLLCETNYKYKVDMYIDIDQAQMYEYFFKYTNLSVTNQHIIDRLISCFEDEENDKYCNL
ncbi:MULTISPECIES: helix-turn-helix domain-containing protein [Blautia]|uniref:helix-turn-helix domain-containing protein n=1 Tax=Blautia TaxID=572511 RepID=UPI000BA35796|nr:MULTISPECIES: helix-turn-helix transcriptional regulator [Blautia]